MGKTTETEISPHLPTSGQIMGALVKSLKLDDYRLSSKNAQRYFAADRDYIVKESSRAEILDGFADALAELGFRLDVGTERTNSTSEIAKMIDWHTTHWDKLRSRLLPRMWHVYPSHLADVWKAYVRLASIDLAIRFASHLCVTDRSLATLEFLVSASLSKRGAYLNQKRKNAKISTWDFADKVGVSDNTVEAWLYRGVRPRDENLDKIASTLSSGSEPCESEAILRELRLLYWVSDITENLGRHLGSDAIEDIIAHFHKYVSLIHRTINDKGQNFLSLKDSKDLVAQGSRSPLASPLLYQLEQHEKDNEWKDDLHTAGSDWIGRVLNINYQVHRSEVKDLIEKTDGQIFKNWGISDPQAYEHYIHAQELHAQGKIYEAITELTKAVELDPLDPVNYFTLGSVKGGIGWLTADDILVTEGLDACWMAVTLDRNWSLPWTEIGLILLRIGKAHEAVEHLRSVRAQCRPIDARYYHTLGVGLHQIGEFSESLAALEYALEMDQWNPQIVFDAAIVAIQSGNTHKLNRYRKSARLLRVSEELERIIKMANIGQRGLSQIDIALFEELRLNDLVQQVARDDVSTYVSRGKIWFQIGNDEQAISDLDTALRLDPDNPDVYTLRGIVYGYTGMYKSALLDMSKAIRIKSNDAMLHYYRGLTYGELDDLDLAIRDFNKVIQLNPYSFDAYRARGDCYRYKCEYEAAILDYDAAIKLNAEDAASYRGRGSARRMKFDLDLAVDDFTTAINLDSEDPFAYRFRGDAHLAKGNFDKAIVDFNATLKLGHTDEVTYRSRANARICKGDLEAALSDFDAAIKCNPESVFAYQGRGLVLEAMGDLNRAQGDFRRARDLGYKGTTDDP